MHCIKSDSQILIKKNHIHQLHHLNFMKFELIQHGFIMMYAVNVLKYNMNALIILI
jgi:hypothetical protein